VRSISNFYLRCRGLPLVGREHEFAVVFDDGALFFPICSEPLTPLGGVFLHKQKIGKTSALRTEVAPAKGRSEGMEAGRREDKRSWQQESAER
jgi:hypothetical protein